MQELREFIRRYGFTGWLILIMAGSLAFHFVLWIVLSVVDAQELYYPILSKLALPASFKTYITQPWSLFTWPLTSLNPMMHIEEGKLAVTGMSLLRLLLDGVIIWGFGRLHQHLLGAQRTRRLVLLAIPVIGLDVLLVGGIISGLGYLPVSFLSGMTPLMILLVISFAAKVPDYPVPLVLLGQVKMKWVALVLFALVFITTGFAWLPTGQGGTFWGDPGVALCQNAQRRHGHHR